MDARRIVLVGGGVRSGKSSFAVELAHRLGRRRAFIATARASDDEMKLRIDRHRREREDAFTTLEQPLALADALTSLDGHDVVVVDCLTHWFTNLLLRKDPLKRILEQVDDVVGILARRRFHAVLVTNEVGMSVHPPTSLGRAFVEVAGWAHQRISRAADEIHLAVLGTVVRIKPGPVEHAS
jgi:adenosylcobinamide kinase / adenosylcobinamide-phosphate guanylyltransferase